MKKKYQIITIIICCLIFTLLPGPHVQGRIQPELDQPLASTAVTELTPIHQFGGAIYTVQIEGNRAYIGQGPRLVSLDITDPTKPTLLGTSPAMADIVESIFVVEDRAYVASGTDGLWIFDISDPTNLAVLGHLQISGQSQSLYVSQDTVYIAAGKGGVLIIDSTDPTNPQQVGIYRGATRTDSVAIYENWLYVADGPNGVKVVDITDLDKPNKVTEYTEIEYAHDVSVAISAGKVWAFVTTGQGGMHILDITEPDVPKLAGIYEQAELTGKSESQLPPRVAFLADGSSHIYFVNLADFTNPSETAVYKTGGTAEQANATADGKYLYVADGYGGLRILVFSETGGVSEIATSMAASWPMNMTFADEPTQTAYLADRVGIKIFDMTDPANPNRLGFYETEGDALDLAVHENKLYVADGPTGLLVLDVIDPAAPALLHSYDTPGSAQSIVVEQSGDKTIAYLADGAGGVHIIDVSGEPKPIIAYGDITAATGVDIQGAHLYVTDAVEGLRLIDVQDPTNPTRLSQTPTRGSAQDVAVKGGYAYVADGDRGLQIFNVGTPALPHKMGDYPLPDARGVTVIGKTAYVADGREGLKIFDVRDPVSPRRVESRKTLGAAENITVHDGQAYVSGGPGGVTVLALAGDEHENDDTCGNAKPIADDNKHQGHTFHKVGDTDWLRFDGEKDTVYVIDVDVPIKSPADVTLELYQDCADTDPHKEKYQTFSSGTRLEFVPPETGPLYLRLSNHDPQTAGANVEYQVALRAVGEPPKESAVIIVAGRYKESDRLQKNIHHITDNAYEMFVNEGYDNTSIRYLATMDHIIPDSGDDSIIAKSGITLTREALRDAIVVWAKEQVKPGNALTLYMMDHGDKGVLYLDEPRGERLLVSELNAWLTELEDAVPGILINVIIEACFSGSFIRGEAESISKDGRIIITSSSQDTRAYASRHGAHFSESLLKSLEKGTNVAESFRQANASVDSIISIQNPLLDANGNRKPNEPDDMKIAAERGFLSSGSFGGIWPPEIFNARLLPVEKARSASMESSRPTQGEIIESSRLIQVEVKDDREVESVWAVIYPPFFSAPLEGRELVVVDVESIDLVKDGDLYTVRYDDFTEGGTYRIMIHARDDDGREAAPVALSLRTGEVIFLPWISR